MHDEPSTSVERTRGAASLNMGGTSMIWIKQLRQGQRRTRRLNSDVRRSNESSRFVCRNRFS